MIFFNAITNQGAIARLNTSETFGTPATGTLSATGGQFVPGSIRNLTAANFSCPSPNEVGLGVCESTDTCGLCSSTTRALNLASGTCSPVGPSAPQSF